MLTNKLNELCDELMKRDETNLFCDVIIQVK